MEPPSEFFCPITGSVMQTPVVATDGCCYEHSAIVAWLAAQAITPMRIPCRSEQLLPNRTLRQQIDDWCAKNHQPAPPPADFAPFAQAASQTASKTFDEAKLKSEPGTTTPPSITATIAPVQSLNNTPAHFISVSGPAHERVPVHICLVLDVSSSMDREATLRNQNNDLEQYANSLMDIVCLGAKAVCHFLDERDTVSIVTFSSTASTLVSGQQLTARGLARLDKVFDNIQPNGRTNLGDGVRAGFEALMSGPSDGIRAMFVLTDGEPNTGPAATDVIKAYHKRQPQTRGFLMHTFAFGFNAIDSPLLLAMSDISGGGNATYVPDAGFVATTFVHATTAVLTTVATDLQLETDKGQACGELYALRSETPRQLLLPSKKAPPPQLLKYRSPLKPDTVCELPLQAVTADVVAPEIVAFTELRQDVGKWLIARGLQAHPEPTKEAELRRRLKDTHEQQALTSDALQALVHDWDDQVQLAVRPEYFYKWGRHYLLALGQAHLLQVATNHKDASLMVYLGPVAQTLCAEADMTFNMLPPPKPSSRHQGQAVRTTETFNDRSAGCIHPQSQVLLADGSSVVLADQLLPGTWVYSSTAPDRKAQVTHVMKSLVGSAVEMCKFPSGLVITPWHPVWQGSKPGGIQNQPGRWVMPADLPVPRSSYSAEEVPAVYSFAVTAGADIVADGMSVITLAHGITDDEVARHAFFGTSRVLRALEAAAPSPDGIHVLSPNAAIVDAQTGLISGYRSRNSNV